MSVATELKEQQLRLPFDRYQRHGLIADVLERLEEGSGSLSVLVGKAEDVLGSLKELIDRSMPEAKDSVDRSLEPYERLPKRKRSVSKGL